MALRTPKQIASKIKSLNKEISLLKRAKTAETKARRAVKSASKGLHKSRGRKKVSQHRRKKR